MDISVEDVLSGLPQGDVIDSGSDIKGFYIYGKVSATRRAAEKIIRNPLTDKDTLESIIQKILTTPQGALAKGGHECDWTQAISDFYDGDQDRLLAFIESYPNPIECIRQTAKIMGVNVRIAYQVVSNLALQGGENDAGDFMDVSDSEEDDEDLDDDEKAE